MAKQKGRLLLIKIGDGAETEAFTTLCGIQSKTLTVNNNNFDVTTMDCTAPGGQLWQEVMTGMRSLATSGNGIFEGGTSLARFKAIAFGTDAADTADAIGNFQVIIPDFGTFEGAFHVDNVEFGGEQEGAVTYSFALASSGAPTFTDAA
ncbi:phage major tail protein, TP901-1 family [Sulfitobacter sp. UBA4523]|jgi:TP901-1 family phage major tail protein|uniref:phage major tail protein, TP901-1 family n=1 Tax=Sulfitobacter sp. UBA4523 TaxID=1947584 RepID=UPI000C4377DF|nr:phage major tail protein, TP901-1 family [Sulfitobacter sp. UBA4523]MAX76560.1 phage major tail protein, TP901-1 family [Roseobacter sp.]HBR41775.1 phage major tail protein, TP901-1 family [Sulfitobacter pontiacus]|tara:strand:- start:15465 stop:15911 length:447 start_codon:yes stop_codon:yes gene_type:complete